MIAVKDRTTREFAFAIRRSIGALISLLQFVQPPCYVWKCRGSQHAWVLRISGEVPCPLGKKDATFSLFMQVHTYIEVTQDFPIDMDYVWQQLMNNREALLIRELSIRKP